MDTINATEMTINGLTPSILWVVLVGLIGICACTVTVLSALEKVQNLREKRNKPQREANSDIMAMLARDKHRLDVHEAAISEMQAKQRTLEEGQRAVCAGVMALLEHELHNGNATEMQEASAGIHKYLLNK